MLANPGLNYGHQDKVVSTLLHMAESDKHQLRTVTGFNLTLDATEEAVKRLTENGVPVLASRISGDGIANVDGEKQRFPGLARMPLLFTTRAIWPSRQTLSVCRRRNTTRTTPPSQH